MRNRLFRQLFLPAAEETSPQKKDKGVGGKEGRRERLMTGVSDRAAQAARFIKRLGHVHYGS